MDEPKPMRELTRIRQERNLSQQRLADASGVNKATINQIERGRRSPNVETLEKLATALGVEVRELFPLGQAPLWSDESERRASVLTWRDLLLHIGAMLQDHDGKYDPTGQNVEEMASLFFTTAAAYRVANPKAGATLEEIEYLELAEDALRTGFRMVEARGASALSGATNLHDYRRKKREALDVLEGTA